MLISSHIARFSVSRVWDFFDNKSTTVLPHCDFSVTVHLIYTTYFDSLPLKSGLNQHNSNLFNINFIYILREQLSSQSLIPSVPSVPQLELYSQRQLSLWSDPIVFIVPKSTWWVLVKIQGDGKLTETQIKKWKFEHFLLLEQCEKWHWKLLMTILDRIWWQNWGKMHLCTGYCHK